jgi:hypothetical protein
MLPRRLALFLFVGLFVLLAAACGSEPAEEPTPEPELSLDELLASAGAKLDAVSTAKFRMIDEFESGEDFFGAKLKTVEGDIRSPDGVSMLVDVEAPGLGFVEIQIVAVGEQSFMKFSRDAPWLPLPLDQVPFNFGTIGPTLSDIITVMRNAAIVGRETIDGDETVRVDGEVVSEEMSELITSVDAGHPIMLSMWFNEADHTLRQFKMVGMLFDMDEPGTSRFATIEVDVPVDIQLPDMAAGS